MRIIVIDDESKTRASIIRLLKRLGDAYKVIDEAANGYDGMLLIKELRPDLVITDIKMPKVNGLDMIENAHESSPDTAYIILSGYAEFEMARRAINLPVEEYLLKPITVEQMQDALNRISIVKKQENCLGGSQTGDYSSITSYIVKEINNNYAQRLYLDEIASQLKVTPEYAGNVFSRETGKTFSVYLRDVRIEKAKGLLKDTDLKIYEIAYKTGYSDVKYFSRVFKECTGVSAKQYIRHQLIEEE